MFQQCPICRGIGYSEKVELDSIGHKIIQKTCSVCNGMKIINDLTGKPPEDIKVDRQPNENIIFPKEDRGPDLYTQKYC